MKQPNKRRLKRASHLLPSVCELPGMRWFWFLLCGLCLLFVLSACEPIEQPSVDGGSGDQSAPLCFAKNFGSPQITSIRYSGPLARQPNVITLSLEWEDLQADLMGGKYRFYLDGKAFEKHSFSEKSVKGKSKGVMNLSFSLPVVQRKKKDKVRLELQLWDSWENPSNRVLLVLEVN